MSKTKSVVSVLPKDLYDRVKQSADAEGRSVSNFVRQVVKCAVAAPEDFGLPQASSSAQKPNTPENDR